MSARKLSWPELAEALDAWQTENFGARSERLVDDAVRDVKAQAANFVYAARMAEERVVRSRMNVEEYLDGRSLNPSINTFGILQSVNGDMDRAAALLEAAIENLERVARMIGVPTTSEVAA